MNHRVKASSKSMCEAILFAFNPMCLSRWEIIVFALAKFRRAKLKKAQHVGLLMSWELCSHAKQGTTEEMRRHLWHLLSTLGFPFSIPAPLQHTASVLRVLRHRWRASSCCILIEWRMMQINQNQGGWSTPFWWSVGQFSFQRIPFSPYSLLKSECNISHS